MSEAEVKKRLVGGSSAERGLDFQARVGAIVMSYLLVERSIQWLQGVLHDLPLQVDAETGGPGDDIRFTCNDGQIVEVQVKRGLRAGVDLWESLLALADGVATGRIAAGVLAVCPNSSGTVRSVLADDIVRIGTGRFDGLRDLGSKFLDKLRSNSIDPIKACSVLRVVTIAAVEGNRETESTACERLALVAKQPTLAWDCLVSYSRKLIEIRGRATSASLARELALRNVELKTGSVETAVQLQFSLRRWLVDTYSRISLIGVSRPVLLEDCWISLKATVIDADQSPDEELDKALTSYHEYASRRRHAERTVDSHTLGRFIWRLCILGGPGIGKSTLLKKLTLEYSKDGFVVFFARLPLVATLMKSGGRRFEDCLVEVALSGSGLHISPSALYDAVILCDALDECGNSQSLITDALHAFAAGHPFARVIVTSRPIGYQPGLLGAWRHYELQPLESNEAELEISNVLDAIPFASSEKRTLAFEQAKIQLKAQHIKGVAARSPLMLTLIAALVAKGVEPSRNRTALYRQLFRLIEDHPPSRINISLPSEPERTRFLDLLGWALVSYGNEPLDETLDRCVNWWAKETGKGTLECQKIVRECLNYWESLGVVERVRTLTQEAITFVHKTFGEFAAARYISTCDPIEQPVFVARAITTRNWKETLSFANQGHLADLVVKVWAELVLKGSTEAAYRLDDAVELFISTGESISSDVFESFVKCCWSVVESNVSSTRYVGGDALCLLAQSNWAVIRESVLINLEATDKWTRIVAWACACISTEPSLPYQRFLQELSTFELNWPHPSHLGGFNLSATGQIVRESFLVGAVQRVLCQPTLDDGLEILNSRLMRPELLSVKSYLKISDLYQKHGHKLPKEQRKDFSGIGSLVSDTEGWNRGVIALLSEINDPDLKLETIEIDERSMLELGAFLAVTNFDRLGMSCMQDIAKNSLRQSHRRMIFHSVARSAGIELGKLIAQARLKIVRMRDEKQKVRFGLYDIPKVDAEPDFSSVRLSADQMSVLEDVILHDGEYAGLNAAQLLHNFEDHPKYFQVLERLIEKGEKYTLLYSAALAATLPAEKCDTLILRRLTSGALTRGCKYLYPRLKGPFIKQHEIAIFRGIEASDPMVAIAAVELVDKLDLSLDLLTKLRAIFESWKSKDDPYPTEGGAVPYSPRDELAKVLVQRFPADECLLISMMQDVRPEVRRVAEKPFVNALSKSDGLHDKVIAMIATASIDSTFLRRAISAGAFSGGNALKVVSLLKNLSAKVRYAAIPILSSEYLPIELIKVEATLLLFDPELEIREGASKALKALGSEI